MQSTASGSPPKCQFCAPLCGVTASVTQLQPAPCCTTCSHTRPQCSPEGFKVKKNLSANRSIDHDVLSSLMNVKSKFLKYYHTKQTQINEGYCDISTEEEGATGFLATKAGKIERPFCAPAPPKQAYREPWTRYSTPWAAVGTSTHSELTGSWHPRIYKHLLGSIVLGFQSGRFHLRRHNCEILCFLPSKTANIWELTVPARCTVRSCKPAWSCQEITYLETHTGLNQTERQPCKGLWRKKLKFLLIHWMSIFPMAAWLRNISVTELSSWKSYHVTIIGFLRGKNRCSSREKTFTAY